MYKTETRTAPGKGHAQKVHMYGVHLVHGIWTLGGVNW